MEKQMGHEKELESLEGCRVQVLGFTYLLLVGSGEIPKTIPAEERHQDSDDKDSDGAWDVRWSSVWGFVFVEPLCEP